MPLYVEGFEWAWNDGWETIVVKVEAGGRTYLGVVLEEGLKELFGARESRNSKKEAYLRNRQMIENVVREMAAAGKVHEGRYVLVFAEDLADYICRNEITPVRVIDPVEHFAGT